MAARPRNGPPLALRRPVSRDYFGTTVVDDYEWLEDGKSADTRSFVRAEDTYARAFLEGLSERPAVHARVAELYGKSSADWRGLRVVGGLVFSLREQPPRQQAMLVVAKSETDLATERVIVDPHIIDPTDKTTIDFFVPSPDGRRVAVSLSRGGTESGDLHIFDVATGAPLTDVIARVNGGTAGGSVAWNADGSGFYYTRYPRAGERPEADLDFYQQVFFHRLGDDAANDVYAIGKEFPRIAEIELERSDDGRVILARVAHGDGGAFEHHVLAGPRGAQMAAWTRLSKPEDERSRVAFGPDGKIYAISRKEAPRGKVVAFTHPFDGAPVPVLPEGDAVIEDLVVTSAALYVVELTGGPSRVRRIPLGGKSEALAYEASSKSSKRKGPARAPVVVPPGARGVAAAELPTPPSSSVDGVVRVGDDLLLRIESYVEPPAWFRYRASEHRLVKTALAKAAPANMSDIEVVRETCASADGTMVPMTILRKKGVARDSKGFALLTGYGGYNVSRKPRLRAWTRVWLDQGGVFADANLRGGGELGEAWHRAGNLTNKQNVFDDFAACARALSDLGYARSERLAIIGRSNGGLLMGGSVVQHPDMFRAVVSAVGIYDMLRVELSSNGAFNVTEYGTVKDEANFRAMLAYSPLHNVKSGTAYPAMLFTTGANDPRVDPYHSRKMVARLRAATSSDRPILLRASADTGHGGGTPLAVEIEETSDWIAFLFHELGVGR